MRSVFFSGLSGLALLISALISLASAADFQALNPHVLDLVGSYPLDGRYPYGWAPGRHTDGVSQPLSWRGTALGLPGAGRAVHCSGITFEVYIQALSRTLPHGGPTGAELLALKEDWSLSHFLFPLQRRPRGLRERSFSARKRSIQ